MVALSRSLRAPIGALALATSLACAPAAAPSLVERGCVQAMQLEPTAIGEYFSDVGSGVVVCGDAWNRTAAVACAAPSAVPPCADPDGGGCSVDADCGAGDVCHGDWTGCRCFTTCTRDDDCPGAEACLCDMGVRNGWSRSVIPTEHNQCVAAQCRTDADCDGRGCGVSFGPCGNAVGLFCRTTDDECVGHAECDGFCAFDDASRRWMCIGAAECE